MQKAGNRSHGGPGQRSPLTSSFLLGPIYQEQSGNVGLEGYSLSYYTIERGQPLQNRAGPKCEAESSLNLVYCE
jgi:hypothetical protein